MKLQFLIPHYNEDESTIETLLRSIQYQLGIINWDEYGVIICNDGSNIELSNEFLKQFPFHIDYIKESHQGMSATRNILLKYATAKYIMCCDADDMFYDMRGLMIITDYINEDNFDILYSAFMQEYINPINHIPQYMIRQYDPYFVHGKVFRREYLISNNIGWLDKYANNGDLYFLKLAFASTKNIQYCNTPFYVWKWNSKSLTKQKNYFIKEYPLKIEESIDIVEELSKRNMPLSAACAVAELLYDAYYMSMKINWDEQINLKLKDYYLKYKNLFENLPKDLNNSIYKNRKQNAMAENVLLEKITFKDWLNSLIKLYNQGEQNETTNSNSSI